MKPLQLTLITALFIILSLASVQALIIDSVDMNPNEITPGKTAKIRIGLENDGKEDITDVTIILDLTGIIESGVGAD